MPAFNRLLLFSLSLACALAFGADGDVVSARKAPAAQSGATGVQQLIVKLREEPPDIAAAGQVGAIQSLSAGEARASVAVARAGLVLAESREIAAGMHADAAWLLFCSMMLLLHRAARAARKMEHGAAVDHARVLEGARSAHAP